jgi:hypothetical protein
MCSGASWVGEYDGRDEDEGLRDDARPAAIVATADEGDDRQEEDYDACIIWGEGGCNRHVTFLQGSKVEYNRQFLCVAGTIGTIGT